MLVQRGNGSKFHFATAWPETFASELGKRENEIGETAGEAVSKRFRSKWKGWPVEWFGRPGGEHGRQRGAANRRGRWVRDNGSWFEHSGIRAVGSQSTGAGGLALEERRPPGERWFQKRRGGYWRICLRGSEWTRGQRR